MKHFEGNQLWEYREGLLNKEKENIVEEHLYTCEKCLNSFLCLISEEEISKAEGLLSLQFTDKVIWNIEKENRKRAKIKDELTKEKWQSFITYYVGAAVMTLLFVSTGIFQSIVDTAPKIVTLTVRVQQEEFNRTPGLGLSTRAVDKAALWIERFETKDKGRFNSEQKK
jgi:predicted anti-sigma-YlaC factor YlaD